MLPTTEAPPQARPAPAGPGFARREPYAAYFARLADWPDAAAGWRRLIPHLDADLDGAERVALWQALWRGARRLDAATLTRLAAVLDGRHAARLAPLGLDWGNPALIEHLLDATPAAAATAFTPALLAHHGLDPLADPAAHAPGLVLHAASAALAVPGRCGPDRIATLQAAVLCAADADPALTPRAMALLFELALHAADADTATAVLAELLNHGHAALLRPERVRGWLDGSAFDDDEEAARPLALADGAQRQWLQPARWRRPTVLAALHGALQRAAPRRRLQALVAQLQPVPEAPAAALSPDLLQRLTALDTAYLLVDAGGDPVPALRPLLTPTVLAPVAIAALLRGSARAHAARGDTEGQALALAIARRHQPTPALRAALAALLPGPVPPLGADWRDEEPYWRTLESDPRWSALATFQLATLATEGLLEPRPPRRCQHLHETHARWLRLAERAATAPWAESALRQPAQTLLRPALQQHQGTEHLWFETPGARQLLVVFSCIATHHSYAEVAALHGRLPGRHLLFVRCPDKNWYCDDAFERTRSLLRARVASRFAREDVACWYGSMGGHGALKFGLEFGWRAIAFNPQTDLDLWAAFRPRERALLWGAERHRRLDGWPVAAWERSPQYVACGSATPDREAFSVLVAQWRRCRRLDLIVEKFDDADHAGLMNRIAGGPVAAALHRIDARLQVMALSTPAADAGLDEVEQAALWDRIDAARTLKLEVMVRNGRLWWQPSLATGTRGRG